MGEFRQNLATKRWVIIASERAKRPHELVTVRANLTADHPAWDQDCPFCVGNEEADLEVARIPAEGPWRVRVVRNRYPAVQMEGEAVYHFDGLHRTINAVGYHEVVVESPRHNTCHALESADDVALLMQTFYQRGHAMATDPRIEHIIYFKNHGERAGTSLVHPHTQIIGLPVVPNAIRSREEDARRHFDETGRCVFCQMLAEELGEGQRLVSENEHFVAFVPYAALSPFHTWILPRRHMASFLLSAQEELTALGGILHDTLRRLYLGINDPDFNYVVRSAPLRDVGYNYLHWYLTIIPRVTQTAGFELGSGMYINTTPPEEAAAFLRSVTV